MPADPKYLLVLDLETTGTDEDEDSILEIGAILVTPDFEQVGSMESIVFPLHWHNRPIKWWEGDWLYTLMDEYVAEMHRTNGLVDDIRAHGRKHGENSTFWIGVNAIQSAMIRWLEQAGEPGEFMLAGSGVGHFDRRFLRAQMPELDRWFQYPVMDVGVIRRFLHLIGRDDLVPQYNSDKPHRALADAQLHLAEMRHYRDALSGLGWGNG